MAKGNKRSAVSKPVQLRNEMIAKTMNDHYHALDLLLDQRKSNIHRENASVKRSGAAS